MSLTTEEKKAHIKELAIKGSFSEIERLYGQKALASAQAFAERRSAKLAAVEVPTPQQPSAMETSAIFTPNRLNDTVDSVVVESKIEKEARKSMVKPNFTEDSVPLSLKNQFDATLPRSDADSSEKVEEVASESVLPKKKVTLGVKSMKKKKIDISTIEMNANEVETGDNDGDVEGKKKSKSKKPRNSVDEESVPRKEKKAKSVKLTKEQRLEQREELRRQVKMDREMKKEEERRINKLVPPAPTAFILFCSAHRAAVASEGLPFVEQGKRLASMWSEADGETKQMYQQQHEALKESSRAKLAALKADPDALRAALEAYEQKRKRKRDPAEGKGESKSGDTKSKSSKKSRKSKKSGSNDSDSSDASGESDMDDGEAAENSENKGDDLAFLRLPVSDPRSEALRKAEARRSAGLASRVKEGFIVDRDEEDNVMPRTRVSMNYSRFLFEKGDKVALVIPAYLEFIQSVLESQDPTDLALQLSQSQSFIPSGLDASFASTSISAAGSVGLVNPARVLSGLQRQGLVSDTVPLHRHTRTGVLMAVVLSLDEVTKEFLKNPEGDEAALGDPEALRREEEQLQALRRRFSGGSQFVPTLKSTSTTEGTQKVFRRTRKSWYVVKLRVDLKATENDSFPDDDDDDDDEEEKDEEEEEKNGASDAAELNSERFVEICIPWLVPQHSLVLDPFILQESAYHTHSLEHSSSSTENEAAKVGYLNVGLEPGTQVRYHILGENSQDASVAEVLEGRLYNVSARRAERSMGFPLSKYKCCKTVWYEQDADTLNWFIDPVQTDNQVSPWDLRVEPGPFMLQQSIRKFVGPPPVTETPEEVIRHLLSTECGAMFAKPVPRSETAYYARIRNPMDLESMLAKALRGAYSSISNENAATTHDVDDMESVNTNRSNVSTSVTGTLRDKQTPAESVWDDVRLIIKNAKIFNPPERSEWRLADMLECEARALKRRYKGEVVPTSSASVRSSGNSTRDKSHGAILKTSQTVNQTMPAMSSSVISSAAGSGAPMGTEMGLLGGMGAGDNCEWMCSQESVDAELDEAVRESIRRMDNPSVIAELKATRGIDDEELSQLD